MALGSILGGLASGVGGSILSQGNQAPGGPQLPNMGDAAASVFGGISGLQNPWQSMQPLMFDQLLAMMQNPHMQEYMRGAQKAGGASRQAGDQAGRGANMLMKDARGLYRSGFDPRNALRHQLEQRTTDQANVLNSMYGLSSSPYGAGVAGQDLKNFNIDWQNQQLQRQLQASQGIGQDVSGAQQLMASRPGDYMASGQIPYSAYTSGVGDINNALDQYLREAQGGNAFQQQGIQDWMQYLGLGNASAGINQNAFDQNQRTAQMYGAGLAPLGQYLGQNFGQMFQGGGTPGAAAGGSPYNFQNYGTPTPDTGSAGFNINY